MLALSPLHVSKALKDTICFRAWRVPTSDWHCAQLFEWQPASTYSPTACELTSTQQKLQGKLKVCLIRVHVMHLPIVDDDSNTLVTHCKDCNFAIGNRLARIVFSDFPFRLTHELMAAAC